MRYTAAARFAVNIGLWASLTKEARQMMKLRSSRLFVAVLAVAAVILVAGGTAVASNMGFKLNRVIVKAGAGQIGNNWISVPYNNPYLNAQGFCTQTGLPNAVIFPPQAGTVVTVLDPVAGTFQSATCGTAPAGLLPITPGRGIQVRPPNIAATPASIIIVGSHNPSLAVTVPNAGAGQTGNTWFAVPYHTTAVNAANVCAASGLTNAIVFPPQAGATITRLNAATGGFQTASCGTSAATSLVLTLGEFIQIREPKGPKTFVPAHF